MRMRRAHFERLGKAGQLKVAQYNAPAVIRPSKLAAGMSFTFSRTKSFYPWTGRSPQAQGPALFLIVRGTTDIVSNSLPRTVKAECGCCGAKTGKLRLSGHGRHLLDRARKRAAARLARKGR
jgi:hypothetical protein